MDGFKKTAGKIFVPSLFILLVLTAVTYCSYAFAIDEKFNTLLFYIASFFLLSAVLFICCRMSMSPGPAGTALLLVTAIALSAVVQTKIKRLTSPVKINAALAASSCTVMEVSHGRYKNRALLAFEGRDSTRRLLCMAYMPLSFQTKSGDTIKIGSQFKTVSKQQAAASGYNAMLYRRGIHCTVYPDTTEITVVERRPAGIKNRIRRGILYNSDRLFGTETSSVIKALYLGNKNYISKATLQTFKEAGVLHVLAASGLHVGILASIPVMLLGLFRIPKKIIFTATSALLLFYLHITDMPVSLIRAGTMFFIFTLTYTLDRQNNLFNTLFISACIIIMFFPYEIYSLGFQLSYGATLGILLFFRAYKNAFSFLPKFLDSSLALTFSAQVIVIPIILMQLHELNLAGFISSIAVVPLTAALLTVSIPVHILGTLDFAFNPGPAADIIFLVMDRIAAVMSGAGGHFYLDNPGPAAAALSSLLLIPLVPVNKKKIAAVLLFICITLLWVHLKTAGAVYNRGAVIEHDDGFMIALKKKNDITITGELPPGNRALDIIRGFNIPSAVITTCITSPDYINLTRYRGLMKSALVQECRLSDSFRMSRGLENFLEIIDLDRIKLKVEAFNKLKSGDFSADKGLSETEISQKLYRNLIKNKISSVRKKLVEKNGLTYILLKNESSQ